MIKFILLTFLINFNVHAGLNVLDQKMGPQITLSKNDSLHIANHLEKQSKKNNTDTVIMKMVCNKKKKGLDFQYKCSPFEVETPKR